VYEETLTGQPHDTSVQKATSDNENVDAVQRHALDITPCAEHDVKLHLHFHCHWQLKD